MNENPGHKSRYIFCKKINTSVLNKIILSVEDDEREKDNFNDETITFHFLKQKFKYKWDTIYIYTKKNITEGSLLSYTKNTNTVIAQTKTKPQKTLEYKLRKREDTSSLEMRLSLEDE